MRQIRFLLLLLCAYTFTDVYAQLSTNEQPVSFDSKLNLTEVSRNTADIVTMPKLDMVKIEAEDKEDEEYDMPPRFGYPHKVNYDLENSGTWYELPNGDKLWQLNVVCPGALSVNFCYDKFWIPEGGKFFLFSKDKKRSIGAFTNKNNKGSREDIRGFATGLVYSDDIILEYYQPKEVSSNAVISIEYVVHGYRYINIEKTGFRQSGPCMVNVNCEEGHNWQKEKLAVAMILVNGYRYCSGSLINTTDLSQNPLLLTANHCISNYGDAEGNSNLYYYSFWWNYESPGCANISVEPSEISTTGATILANNSYSDFALLRLTEDPKDLLNYTPYYLGWDRTGFSGDPGVCIHHPSGDIKKISTVYSQPVSSSYSGYSESSSASHWRVTWKSTLNGHSTTEGGSSGSPLLNATHRIIGQLHGGYANCYDSINAPDWYGKFNVSWTGNNNNSVYRRLSVWIDSSNTGLQTMEGLLIIPSTTIMNSDQELYSNIRITNSGKLTISSDIELIGNCKVIVESGGQLIIDGGKLSNVNLVLKSGSSLRLINNGIIETTNDFILPVGATLEINCGQIL